MAKFTLYNDTKMVKTYHLDEPVITIGRLPESTISIPAEGVSRCHVKIIEDVDKTLLLSDLNSLNGTFVNGVKVKEKTLENGDKITVGNFTIVYETGNVVMDTADPAVQSNNEEKTTQSGSEACEGCPQESNQPDKSSQAADSSNTAVFIDVAKRIIYRLDRPNLSIGSDEGDDIFASGLMISKAYAEIESREDGFLISVKKIVSKMKVNGKYEKSRLLRHKDRIEIGNSTFRYMEKE
ncbi:FHA domain containing protein [Chitinispirillum alkaliphilum]|nr:FHA domain containing protein [Chitinispirillum alkaliphilum]